MVLQLLNDPGAGPASESNVYRQDRCCAVFRLKQLQRVWVLDLLTFVLRLSESAERQCRFHNSCKETSDAQTSIAELV